MPEGFNLYHSERDFSHFEEEVIENGDLFRFVVESSGMVVFKQDKDLRYTWIVNPQPPFSPENVIGKTDADLLPEEDAAQLTAVKRRVLESGEKTQQIVRTTIEGQPYYYELTVEPDYDQDREIIGVLCSSVDVTYYKKIEDALRQVNEELEDRVLQRTRELTEEIAERKQIQSELAEMQRYLMNSVENERTLLARELHDGPMQEIYALMYQLSSWSDAHLEGHLADELERFQSKLKKINRSLRSIARDLRPSTLAEFGLEKSIREHLANHKLTEYDLEVHLDLDADRQSLPEPVRLALYRIYQIAFTNVIRHAQATRVDIRLRLEAERLLLEVEDNGVGFELPADRLTLAREGHLGLLGAYERARAIRGKLQVRSEPGEGTLVRVVVPRELKENFVSFG